MELVERMFEFVEDMIVVDIVFRFINDIVVGVRYWSIMGSISDLLNFVVWLVVFLVGLKKLVLV